MLSFASKAIAFIACLLERLQVMITINVIELMEIYRSYFSVTKIARRNWYDETK